MAVNLCIKSQPPSGHLSFSSLLPPPGAPFLFSALLHIVASSFHLISVPQAFKQDPCLSELFDWAFVLTSKTFLDSARTRLVHEHRQVACKSSPCHLFWFTSVLFLPSTALQLRLDGTSIKKYPATDLGGTKSHKNQRLVLQGV